MEEHLLSKHIVLSSNTITPKTNKTFGTEPVALDYTLLICRDRDYVFFVLVSSILGTVSGTSRHLLRD
jgi:hypothetical protein